jgi:transglutaminase-like putative cysteine protease
MDDYLQATEVIDWQDERILALAEQLSDQTADDVRIAKNIFEWVRDNVEHSVDFERSELTCRASDVLAVRTGFCYAKSHLVAALMRANAIPAGFCYQRLSMNDDGPPYCLHGLNAVFLKSFGWYRIDARGNTQSISAQFSPPHEQLAFQTADDQEADLPEIWSAPLPCVVSALRTARSVEELRQQLPDVPLICRPV